MVLVATPKFATRSFAVNVVVEMFVQVQPPLVSVPVTVRFLQFTSVNFVAAACADETKPKARREASRYFLMRFPMLLPPF
jgi:hypothetical protein